MSKGTIAAVVVLASALGMTSGEKASNAANSAGTAVNDAAKATGKALDSAAQATGEALDHAAKATGEGLNAAGEYLSRQDEVKTSREAIEDLKTKWGQLRDKTETTSAAAKAEFQKLEEQMVQGLDEADRKLVAAGEASADTWQAAESALDGALQKTQELYEEARVRFGD